jgi:hypothetical protein
MTLCPANSRRRFAKPFFSGDVWVASNGSVSSVPDDQRYSSSRSNRARNLSALI